jgi:broad specificity phosphatase PhoE
MLEIWFIRHGQTDWNLQQRWQGQTDVPLNALGLTQAGRLAERLARVNFDAVYSSDLGRCVTTASIALPQLRPVLDARLREMHFGGLEGKSWAEMDEGERAALERWRQDPYGVRLAGGESFQDLHDRLQAWRGELPSVGRVAAFTHGGNIRNLLWSVVGPPREPKWSVVLDNTGITRLGYESKRISVVCVNDCAHLETE